MKYLLYFLFLIVLFSCSDSGETDRDCEVVINADGPGFLKVINEMNSKIEVYLPEYALAAIVRTNTCEIYGLNTGTRKAEISICVDNDCDTYSKTKKVSFLIEKGKTYVIEINGDFFNK